jgi:PAS domain S-box-containing protein
MKNIQEDIGIRLQAIFDASVDGIITINDRGIVESLNAAACQLFGYTQEEVIGQNVSMLMPQPHRREHDKYIKHYQETGLKKIIGIGREVLGKRKDKSTFPFQLSVSEVKLKNRTIYTGFIHDISDQKKAEKELLELTDKLERRVEKRTKELEAAFEELKSINQHLKKEIEKRKRAEKKAQEALNKELELGELKSRFVSMASHEFRTPLTGILSSIALISKYNTAEQEEKKNKHIKRIRTSVYNLTSILNDFLSLDKLQAGKIKCNPIVFNFSVFMEDIVEEVMQLLKPGQEIVFKNEGDAANFCSDTQLLKNILLNLISNAIKYSYDDGNIFISSKANEQRFEIEIRDEGIGIPEEEQKHLFERFFRAKNAGNVQGTGLGLNIVSQYVTILKGNIQFESAENKGTTFKLEIPSLPE